MRGANGEAHRAGRAIVSLSLSMMKSRDFLACFIASRMMSIVMPSTLMSIWIAVMPVDGARDLEVHLAERVFEALDVGEDRVLLALEDQAHRDARDVLLIGTPASISASVEPQTDAIDDEPLDSSISLIRRIVYGNSSFGGSTGTARVPRDGRGRFRGGRGRASGASRRPRYGGKL